jgi:hypothetical protein
MAKKTEKAATVTIKVNGRTVEVPKDRLHLERILRDGVMLTNRIEALKAELDAVKAKMRPYGFRDMKASGRKSAKLIGAAGLCEITISTTLSIADANVPLILDLLGEEVGTAMIVQKVAYRPSTAMKNLLANADDPRGVKLRMWVDAKERESVKFTAA